MDALLRWLGQQVCTKHWAAVVACGIVIAGYEALSLYLSRTPPVDLSGIEQRLSTLEAKQDELLKLLQPPQAPLLSPEEEALFGEAHQLLATIFDIDRLEKKLAIPAF